MKVEGIVMFLNIVSIVLIVALTLYVTYYTYKNRKHLTCMAGMMIAMTNAMMSSVALGTILGVISDVELSTPTMIAVVFGMIVGYFTGKPISLMAALDGLGAGVMGGMMGAMLGVMLFPTKVSITIVFILAVFVIVNIVLLKVIDEEISSRVKKKEDKEKLLKKPVIASPTFLIVIVGFIAFSVVSSNIALSQFEDEIQDFTILPTIYEGDFTQQALINVELFTYEPNNIAIEAGEPTVLNFHGNDLLGCSRFIYSNDLDFRVNITPGESNFLELDALEPGTYNYACTMNMYRGSITVY